MRFSIIWVCVAGIVFASCLSGDTGSSFDEQLQADIKAIDDYLVFTGKTALKDVSGVRFSTQTVGKGFTPRISDVVTFDYALYILGNPTPIQQSTLTDQSITGLIPGMQVGLTLLPVGSIATIYIPSGYGYGTQGSSGIPGNANLIFSVNLKSVKVTAEELSQLAGDTVKIDEFIANQGILDVVKDSTGLRYKIEVPGIGQAPTWFDKVKVNYAGYLLVNGEKGAKFYEGSNEPGAQSDSRVVNYIRGFQAGLQRMTEGAKATLYVPSGLGFGGQSVTGGLVSVPANSNLVYEVELIEVLGP